MKIDLNSDMGESFGAWRMGEDRAMLEIVSTANIACGFHAGDPEVIEQTLQLAKQNQVGVGAHPSFMDLYGFGRRQIKGDSPNQIKQQIIYQIGAVKAIAESIGYPIRHVKTHGSLGNMASEDAELAMIVAQAIYAVDPSLIFVVMPGMETEKAGLKIGLPLAREIYIDRAYAENGNLLSRQLPGALLHDSEQASRRIMQMIEQQSIFTVSGQRIPVTIDTICVHGDNPNAVEMAKKVRQHLEANGITIARLDQLIH